MRKLVGVLASLVGVVLISSVDLSGANDDNRGSFPHKSTAQIAIGDAMAFFSAIIYGVYVTVMKRRVGNEERVNMPLFFGLVGLFNVFLLWPGFFILHYTGIETVGFPPFLLCVWLADLILTCNPVRTAPHGERVDHNCGKLPQKPPRDKSHTDQPPRSTQPPPSAATSSGPTPCCSPPRSSSPSACP